MVRIKHIVIGMTTNYYENIDIYKIVIQKEKNLAFRVSFVTPIQEMHLHVSEAALGWRLIMELNRGQMEKLQDIFLLRPAS